MRNKLKQSVFLGNVSVVIQQAEQSMRRLFVRLCNLFFFFSMKCGIVMLNNAIMPEFSVIPHQRNGKRHRPRGALSPET